eukprot:Lithocolla_globosa_v1_NODE_1807_length_2321_cov_196.591792.p1 type:complete len:298 gc:universal NODE_1807_length_2321_cov_196.591792:2270-1377(-)
MFSRAPSQFGRFVYSSSSVTSGRNNLVSLVLPAKRPSAEGLNAGPFHDSSVQPDTGAFQVSNIVTKSCVNSPSNLFWMREQKRSFSTGAPMSQEGGFNSPLTEAAPITKADQLPQDIDFSKHLRSGDICHEAHRNYDYFVVGATSMLSFFGAKQVISTMVQMLGPSNAVLAAGSVEVKLGNIPVGKTMVLKWRGKPVFIRHRSDSEIQEADSVNIGQLRDPETDDQRVKKKEWLIMLGICTHLGCVPLGDAGNFGGWFCPCHGSHYDSSGRIREGPAPLNLEVPKYSFLDDETVVIG